MAVEEGRNESFLQNLVEERLNLMRMIGLMMLLAGMAGTILAGPATPEIDSTSAIGALALLSGALLVIRGRRRRR